MIFPRTQTVNQDTLWRKINKYGIILSAILLGIVWLNNSVVQSSDADVGLVFILPVMVAYCIALFFWGMCLLNFSQILYRWKLLPRKIIYTSFFYVFILPLLFYYFGIAGPQRYENNTQTNLKNLLPHSYTDNEIAQKIPRGYRQIVSYKNDGWQQDSTCSSSSFSGTPECGYCPGVVVNQLCYVKQGNATNWQ